MAAGYYMPAIFGVYATFADQLTDTTVIRLHRPDREGIEERTGADWSRIIEPRDADLDALAGMLGHLKSVRHRVWLFGNNHFEGCAPLTLKRTLARVADTVWRTRQG